LLWTAWRDKNTPWGSTAADKHILTWSTSVHVLRQQQSKKVWIRRMGQSRISS
jgi:hypothetical protein